MQQSFLNQGVNIDHLRRYSGHKIGEALLDEVAGLINIFHALKEGAPTGDFFGVVEAEMQASETATAFTETAYASSVTKSALDQRVVQFAVAVITSPKTSPQEAACKANPAEEVLHAKL